MSETNYVEAVGQGYELACEYFEEEYGHYPTENDEDIVDDIYEMLCDKYRI